MDVALPFGHPLAEEPEIDLADLRDADWILATPGVPCWRITRDACERAGFLPRVRHYADEFVGVVGLIAAGHGVSLLPRLAQPEFVDEAIVLKPVSGVSPVRRVGAQIRSGTAEQPHIAPVLTSLRRAAADVADGPLECRPALYRAMVPVASTA
jgi:DNA-binding transcriptional LysR family regulator